MKSTIDDEDRARAYGAFLDDVQEVSHYGDVSFAAALAVDLVEVALDDALGHGALTNDRPWAKLVGAIDSLLTAHPAAHLLPSGMRLERFVLENADLLYAGCEASRERTRHREYAAYGN
jgi:hypothetical protein